MGYYVTDCLCSKCKLANYNYHEIGQPTSYSYIDFYSCPNCGHDPDKDREQKDEETLDNL
jgi:hypothetical protein